MTHFLLILASYFVGAIPFGALVAKSMGVDIMKVGSGNIGATNVYRTLGPKAAWFVFALDVLKGLVPTLLAGAMLNSPEWGMFAGMSAVAGHMLSPFLRFRGGKGIATTLGVLIGGSPVVACLALAVFIFVVALTRYISLGAMIAAVVAVIGCALFHVSVPVLTIFGLLCGIILLKHIPNAKRLLAGTEAKFTVHPKPLVEQQGSSEEIDELNREAPPVGGKR